MAEVDKAITELTKELQRSPSVGRDRRAARAGDGPTCSRCSRRTTTAGRSRSTGRPAATTPRKRRPSEWIGDEDESFELVEGRIALDAALPYLDERERLVLRLRFVDDMTQSQIAERVGHSQMHVSRILRRALTRIREQIREQEQQPQS